jgi:hypothetical protein
LHDVADNAVIPQHAAEHASFRFPILRRQPLFLFP